ncbi:Aste57867_1860 [Aphanomyces stellatus]|uniref:Aste57867_1860 protein n=1 Tax=Aphanomyces stellatus TaxID=120398 RepID=A0A485K645_9STRA|nr:hypothetical protein As57867_001858 [Aphanomyces stellatus]VFT79067.1 Aste57867_1860 [Aphanomyces stellatus]
MVARQLQSLGGAGGIPTSAPIVAYLDLTDSSATVAALQPTACSPPQLGADFLYDIAYVQPLLQYTLSDVGDWLNTTNNFIVVDCSFDGRTLGDTTAFKLYLIDKTMTNLSTLIVQTMSVSRPDKHLLTTDLFCHQHRPGDLFCHDWVHLSLRVGHIPIDYAQRFESRSHVQWQAVVESAGERFKANFLANGLPGNCGMNLWAYREHYTVHYAIILIELTWLYFAIAC